MCNALIELLPQPESPFDDRPLRLTNATGIATLEMTSQRAWLLLPKKEKKIELTLAQAYWVMANFFAVEVDS